MDNLNIVVYRYRNDTYVKDAETELKWTEYEKFLSERVHLLSYIDVSLSGALYWMKQLFIIKKNFFKNACFYPHELLSIVPGIKNVN